MKIIDPYANGNVISLIESCEQGINIQILRGGERYRGRDDLLLGARNYKNQYGHIEVRSANNLHGRFIIIDDTQVYQLGDSISHIADKKDAMVDEIQTPQAIQGVLTNFNNAWGISVQEI